ncbi:MAG: site-2 protease family protein [Thermoanaerobaculia bacterium]
MSESEASAPAAAPRRKERWWLHGLLFAATFLTTTYAGLVFAAGFRPALLLRIENAPSLFDPRLFKEGLVFSLPLLAILLAHELGHYLVCRRYGIDASPPYFIPFPPQVSLVGTMGAFIRIREQIRDKRQLFDMAVAGPIAGFAVSVPLLAWGVSHSRVNPSPALSEGTVIFQYPILVQLFQKIFAGATYTSVDVIEHPVFLAAWFGLFVTALNLLPLGQLDGGHTVYAVFGRFQRVLALSLLVVLALLGLKWPGWWVWVLFTLFTGIRHPPVSNEGEPLDDRRKLVAAGVLLIFVLCFAPVPIEIL